MTTVAYVGWAVLAALACGPYEPPLARHDFTQTHMGMPFRITLYAPDRATANAASEAAFRRIAELNLILSDYDPASELSRLSSSSGSGQAVLVSEPLWFVLSRAQDLAERTDGAFDVTVGPLVRLWRRAQRTGELPNAARLAAARQVVGHRLLRFDPASRSVELLRHQMRLDLGGIAAGYAVDEALAVLRRFGVTRALVDGSGDIGAGDPPPDATGWRIGIAPLDAPHGPPSRYLLLANAAVTTSGDAFQHVEIGGKRYSHIVDPHTGLGLTDRSSVTVVAGDCITADSLATAVSVLGPDKGFTLIEATPNAAALVVRHVAGKLQTYESERLNRYQTD